MKTNPFMLLKTFNTNTVYLPQISFTKGTERSITLWCYLLWYTPHLLFLLFKATILEYTKESFICSFDGCKKVCKSKCGLKIHSRLYMPSLLNIKVINKLNVIIKDSLIKLSIDSCYSDKVRDVFKSFKIEKS